MLRTRLGARPSACPRNPRTAASRAWSAAALRPGGAAAPAPTRRTSASGLRRRPAASRAPSACCSASPAPARACLCACRCCAARRAPRTTCSARARRCTCPPRRRRWCVGRGSAGVTRAGRQARCRLLACRGARSRVRGRSQPPSLRPPGRGRGPAAVLPDAPQLRARVLLRASDQGRPARGGRADCRLAPRGHVRRRGPAAAADGGREQPHHAPAQPAGAARAGALARGLLLVGAALWGGGRCRAALLADATPPAPWLPRPLPQLLFLCSVLAAADAHDDAVEAVSLLVHGLSAFMRRETNLEFTVRLGLLDAERSAVLLIDRDPCATPGGCRRGGREGAAGGPGRETAAAWARARAAVLWAAAAGSGPPLSAPGCATHPSNRRGRRPERGGPRVRGPTAGDAHPHREPRPRGGHAAGQRDRGPQGAARARAGAEAAGRGSGEGRAASRLACPGLTSRRRLHAARRPFSHLAAPIPPHPPPRQARCIKDCAAYFQSCTKPAGDVFATNTLVSSLAVVPLSHGSTSLENISNVGGLYFLLPVPCDFGALQDAILGAVSAATLVAAGKLRGQFASLRGRIAAAAGPLDEGAAAMAALRGLAAAAGSANGGAAGGGGAAAEASGPAGASTAGGDATQESNVSTSAALTAQLKRLCTEAIMKVGGQGARGAGLGAGRTAAGRATSPASPLLPGTPLGAPPVAPARPRKTGPLPAHAPFPRRRCSRSCTRTTAAATRAAVTRTSATSWWTGWCWRSASGRAALACATRVGDAAGGAASRALRGPPAPTGSGSFPQRPAAAMSSPSSPGPSQCLTPPTHPTHTHTHPKPQACTATSPRPSRSCTRARWSARR
jgi:hypothetical protein